MQLPASCLLREWMSSLDNLSVLSILWAFSVTNLSQASFTREDIQIETVFRARSIIRSKWPGVRNGEAFGMYLLWNLEASWFVLKRFQCIVPRRRIYWRLIPQWAYRRSCKWNSEKDKTGSILVRSQVFPRDLAISECTDKIQEKRHTMWIHCTNFGLK